MSGPGWDPVPLTETIAVATPDTTIGATEGTDPVGTYEVATSVVTVELAGTEVEARVSEPIGATGLRPGIVFVHGAGTGRSPVAPIGSLTRASTSVPASSTVTTEVATS